MRRIMLLVPLLLALAAPAIAGGPWFARGRTVSTRPLPAWSLASVPLATLYPTGAAADSFEVFSNMPATYTMYKHVAPPDSMKDSSDSTYAFVSVVSTGVATAAINRFSYALTTCPEVGTIDSVVVAYKIKRWVSSGTVITASARPFVGGKIYSTAYQVSAPTDGSSRWVFVTIPSSVVDAAWSEWTADRVNSCYFGMHLNISTTAAAATVQLRVSEMRVLVYGPPSNEYAGRQNVVIAAPPVTDDSVDELKDTYYVAAAATEADTLVDESCTATSVGEQTVAGTHDSTATTRHRLHLVGSGSETETPWAGSLSVDWSALERAGTYSGTISFIRLIYTARAEYLTGRAGYMSELDNCYYLDPRWGGFSQPSQAIMLFPGNPASESYVDYAVDDLGEAWTHTKLVSQQFGFMLGGFGSDDAESVYPDLDCEEFRVEVYGPK